MNTHKIFNLAIVFVFAFSLLGTPVPALAQEPNPTFAAHLSMSGPENVAAYGWPVGANLTLTIDDLTTAESPDYTAIKTMPDNDLYGQNWVDFELPSFDLRPGQFMAITDGTTTKTHTVRTVAVTTVDPDTDTIAGTAEPNTEVGINAHYNPGGDYVHRNIVTDGDGNWTVNLSTPGPNPDEEPTYDIVAGSWGTAFQWDEDNDSTFYAWRVPKDPQVQVALNRQEIHCSFWPFGAELTLTIDDPDNGTGVDYLTTHSVDQISGDETFALFTLGGQYEIQPGDLVTVTDGTTTKQHTVYHLDLTSLDHEANVFTGTATPGQTVRAYIWDSQNGQCSATASGTGDWTINVSDPACEQPYDLQSGNEGALIIEDPNNTATQYFWRVPDPRIFVTPNEEQVHAWDWLDGTLLTLTIDNPATPQSPDYTATQVAVASEDWEHGFELSGIFDIQSGFVVTVSGGGFTKEHTVTHLTVTNIDIDTDTVSGIGTPGSYVHVGTVCDEAGCANRNITVDENGNWLADFSVPEENNAENGIVFDLRLGSGASAFEGDDDGDSTKVNWSVFNPTIGVDVDIDRVQGWDWPLGATVSFEIDDPSTSDHPDYTYTAIAHVSDWDPNFTWFSFITNDYDLKPGDIVTATDGTITKQLVVTSFRITAVDLDTDIVYGVANPGQEVKIWTYNPYAHDGKSINREAIADSNGNWFANFGIPGDDDSEQETADIRNGWSFDSMVGDEDWDNTRCMWDTPNPTIEVRSSDDTVHGLAWTLGSTVTVTVDDPSTGTDPDITRTTIVYEAPWNPGEFRFDLDLYGVIDIQTGFEVTASDDEHNTKTLVVQSFGFSNIDLNLDTVSGFAPPNSTVYIWTCWQGNPCINREETSDQDGNWVTNFAIPGEQEWEQETADLQAGSWIDSGVDDEDGDSTMYGWYVPIPNIEANPGGDWVVARGWPNGTVLTLTIDDPSNGPSIDKTMNITMGPSSWDPNDIAAATNPMSDFDLQPGHIIKVTDGTTEATYVPTNLTVTNIDLEADTISGVAEPGIEVVVWVGVSGSHILRYVTADTVTGYWIADYGHPGQRDDEQQLVDLVPGSEGFVKDIDTNGSATHVDWQVPDNQPPVANAGTDRTVFAGETITLDASASSDPEASTLNYEWDLDNDGQYDDATGVTATTSFNQTGVHTIGLRVTDNGGLSDIDTTTITVLPWALKGFYQPVDMNGVYNIVKGGSTVPLKFEIFAGSTELTDIADVRSLTYAQTSCDANTTTDEIETTTTGGTSLRYADGQFIYNWKTPKTAGKCYRVTMTTIEGSSLAAYFKLK